MLSSSATVLKHCAQHQTQIFQVKPHHKVTHNWLPLHLYDISAYVAE